MPGQQSESRARVGATQAYLPALQYPKQECVTIPEHRRGGSDGSDGFRRYVIRVSGEENKALNRLFYQPLQMTNILTEPGFNGCIQETLTA